MARWQIRAVLHLDFVWTQINLGDQEYQESFY